jgi:hypothetical protein
MPAPLLLLLSEMLSLLQSLFDAARPNNEFSYNSGINVPIVLLLSHRLRPHPLRPIPSALPVEAGKQRGPLVVVLGGVDLLLQLGAMTLRISRRRHESNGNRGERDGEIKLAHGFSPPSSRYLVL